MTTIEEDPQEAGVPEMAASVLTAAQHRAAQAGHPMVLVKDGWLVRIQGSRTILLKKLPARQKVTMRTIKRTHE